MKIKELSPQLSLDNIKVNLVLLKEYSATEVPDEGYIVGLWNLGLWVKKNLDDQRIHPICFTNEFPTEAIGNLDIIDNPS